MLFEAVSIIETSAFAASTEIEAKQRSIGQEVIDECWSFEDVWRQSMHENDAILRDMLAVFD